MKKPVVYSLVTCSTRSSIFLCTKLKDCQKLVNIGIIPKGKVVDNSYHRTSVEKNVAAVLLNHFFCTSATKYLRALGAFVQVLPDISASMTTCSMVNRCTNRDAFRWGCSIHVLQHRSQGITSR